jgi:HTH-type transcriptional regulator / antitoxin HipB
MTQKQYPSTFAEHKDLRYGKIGTPSREDFERQAQAFILGEMIKEERHLANLTQEALANKVGMSKNFISRIENGQSNIQLDKLYKVIEGLGKRLTLSIV